MSPLRLFDTHCHIDMLEGDAAAQLNEARRNGLRAMVVPAISPNTWENCARIVHNHSDLRLALGIHPHAIRQLTKPQLNKALDILPERLSAHNAIAVGEIGIDHRYEKDEAARHLQKYVFERQLAIAKTANLPVLVHCLNAHDTMQRIFQEGCWPERGGILHSYSGSAELIKSYSRYDRLMFSFCGPVTRQNARKTPKAVRAVPDDRLLIETDAPYQAPYPHQNTPCRPEHLYLIAQTVAQLRSSSLEAIAAQTWHNAQRLFNWPDN